MVNRINIKINSRVYTVVAEEDEQYLKNLGDYINEKVKLVIDEGTHVMGEKPLVLAALNICDEYFKLLQCSAPSGKVSELIAENNRLEAELSDIKKEFRNLADKGSEIYEELDLTQKILEETEEKVKFLEGQITLKENQMKKQRSEFALREKELLDILEEK